MARVWWPRLAPAPASMPGRSTLEKRCFSSASQTGCLPPFSLACRPWRVFGGRDWPRPRHPCRVVRPSKSVAFRLLRRPGACLHLVLHAVHGACLVAAIGPGPGIHAGSFDPRKALLFVCFADRVLALMRSCMPSMARVRWPRLAPAPASMPGRSTLEKLCFSSASQTGSHPSTAIRTVATRLGTWPTGITATTAMDSTSTA